VVRAHGVNRYSTPGDDAAGRKNLSLSSGIAKEQR
jgi:hypothetical protein